MRLIPYGHQAISEADVAAVIEVLRSDWLTQGPMIKRFEEAVARYCGARYAVAVTSATAALHVSCLALGLGKGDWLWTSVNTFVASANCALYCGAKVDFVDIDHDTLNMSVDALEEKLRISKSAGTLPKVVVPVHFAGHSCEMDRIHQLSLEYDFKVIEDASHAIGGSFNGSRVGSCRYSDVTVHSFHPVKLITTGEGGMVLTNDRDLFEKLRLLRSHGITRQPEMMSKTPDGPWYYEQIALGYNYRMSDLQAALGISQLKRLDEFVERRNALADRYQSHLSEFPLKLPVRVPKVRSAFHLYVIRLQLDKVKMTRKEVFCELRERGILVNVHYIPVPNHPFYKKLGFTPSSFPIAERYYHEALTLPLFFELTELDQDRVISALTEVLK